MPITSLKIKHFRNLDEVLLFPNINGLNIIFGENGSGKTSLLEAIHYLSLGRSFRSAVSASLIQHQQEKFSIIAQLQNETSCSIPMGIERDTAGKVQMRIAEQSITSLLQLANYLPVRTITSHSHHLFESGPVFRRKYLDWGLFYYSPHFINEWRNFVRVFKQRNALLRLGRLTPELEVWTEELIHHGLALDHIRQAYISELWPIIQELAYELLGLTNLNLNYRPGWPIDDSYREAVTHSAALEFKLGRTLYGPHRADFEITMKDLSTRHFLSRGQQKLLVCAMILAQGIAMTRTTNQSLAILVDDLPSELDLHSRKKLISLLSRQQTQIFVTAIEYQTICSLMEHDDTPMTLFHVEQGRIRRAEI